MNDQYSFSNIDSLLFQLALQTRELAQKKNGINQQMKGLRADIAERRSYIEGIHRNIKKLEEEIRVKQNTLAHNKANVKSMKLSNSLLHQYEQTLKEELESRKASYNHDTQVYEERIVSCRKTFQSHKEYYCKNPLAQKLLTLQAEKEGIESRIKACDDEITLKQKELDHLAVSAVSSNFSSTEEQADSVYDHQPIKEPEKQLEPHAGEDHSDSSIDISSLQLNQTKILEDGHKSSIDENSAKNHEENNVQTAFCSIPLPKEASNGLLSCQQLNEKTWQEGMHIEEHDQEVRPEDQVLAQESDASDAEKAGQQEEMDRCAAVEEEQTPSTEDNEALAAFPLSSSQETNPQSSPATAKAVPSTPTFSFNFSPSGSPHGGTADTKSPAFPFCLNADCSTPGFSGFGFDTDTSQDEDSSFTFTGPLFNEKKTTDSKASWGPEFLFDQQEQSEEFQFAFSSKSPQKSTKDATEDGFPFSFNF